MATKTPKLTLDELAAQYGYGAAFFFSDPELRRLIEQAVREQWTSDKFRAKFFATTWYRTKSASVRTWLELEARDPAEVQARISQQSAVLSTMASQMGISLDPARANRIARDSLMFGWNDQQLRQALGAEFVYQPKGGTQGQAATLETQLRQMANDYGVGVSDSQVAQWIGGFMTGQYTEDNFRDFIADMARSKYPGMSVWLDQGLTVRDVADNYMQSYSRILEQPMDTIQLNDPLIQRALQGTVKPIDKTGLPQMQTVFEFEQGLRKDPRWLRTKNARSDMTNVGLGILQDMGLYA